MNEKEARENVKEQLEGIKKANECGLATKGEFNRDIEAIETVLNLLEKKDKIIDLLIKELYTKAHISTRCYLQTSTKECMKYKNCYECLKKYFENKERRNNGKGN